VDAVFDRVLAKDAKMRFPSVEAFAEALEIAVTGASLTMGGDRPVATHDSEPPPAQRMPSLVDVAPPPERTPPPSLPPAPLEKTLAVAPSRPPPASPPPKEKTPAPEKPVSIHFELDDKPPPVKAPSIPPAGYQPPVWKIRESEAPPSNSMARMVVIGIIIAVLAAAGGVWYGRQGRAPQHDGTTSGDVDQGR
jgi:hypothetical protein